MAGCLAHRSMNLFQTQEVLLGTTVYYAILALLFTLSLILFSWSVRWRNGITGHRLHAFFEMFKCRKITMSIELFLSFLFAGGGLVLCALLFACFHGVTIPDKDWLGLMNYLFFILASLIAVFNIVFMCATNLRSRADLEKDKALKNKLYKSEKKRNDF